MSIKQRESVEHIMTKQPISVNLTDDLNKVYHMMHENCIRHLPVVSGTKLIGILSKMDLERISFTELDEKNQKIKSNFFTGYTIAQVMTKNVQSLQLEDSVKDAAETLSFGNFHAVPILDGDKLVGIVTSTDVINYLLELY
ncbi:MAG: CBS domain-containing protein [Saprospiraceae bacterium]